MNFDNQNNLHNQYYQNNLVNNNNHSDNSHLNNQNNLNNLNKLKRKISEKTLNILNTKYNDYIYFNNENINLKQIKQILKKDVSILYIINSKIKKVKINRIITENIIQVYRGKTKKFYIYIINIYFIKIIIH